jgi:hypothetical protein
VLGIELGQNEKDTLLNLYDNFIYEVKNSVIKKYDPTSIISELHFVNNNNRTSIFTNISINLTADISNKLQIQELIQSVSVQGIKKWTFTLKGLAYIISNQELITFADQYSNLLKNFDDKFNFKSNTKLDWKEKLATLSLLVMASTSKNSSIKLDNSSNRDIFEKILTKTLDCLKHHKIVDKKRKLPKSRGEPPSTLFMRSRINDLPAKTNDVYVNLGKGKGYYLDIEQELELNKEKMWFLLNLVFEPYNAAINYDDLKNELITISEQYSTQMLTRNVDSGILFDTLNKIDEYFNIEIHYLSNNE